MKEALVKVGEAKVAIMPLVYLIVLAGIAAGFHLLGVDPKMTMLIVGAGLTRVKITK